MELFRHLGYFLGTRIYTININSLNGINNYQLRDVIFQLKIKLVRRVFPLIELMYLEAIIIAVHDTYNNLLS